MAAGKVRLYRIFVGWPKTQLQAPTPRRHRHMLALLPMATTGSGVPSPRLPPSKRQNNRGVMAIYVDIFRRGWVGQACSKNIRWNAMEIFISPACRRGASGRRRRCQRALTPNYIRASYHNITMPHLLTPIIDLSTGPPPAARNHHARNASSISTCGFLFPPMARF